MFHFSGKSWGQKFTILFLIAVIAACVWFFSKRPSNDRDWVSFQAVLPTVEIRGDNVSIHNIRNFSYTSGSLKRDYYDREFPLSNIRSVDLILSPFNKWPEMAHPLFSFGLTDGNNVTISLEGRLEAGEKYTPWDGLLRKFELTYSIADERDALAIRGIYLKRKVYLFQLHLSPEEARALFLNMLKDAQEVYDNPQFYNPLVSSCAISVGKELRSVMTGTDIPLLRREFILSTHLPELLREIGILDTDIDVSSDMNRFLINKKLVALYDSPNFSDAIREDYPR